MELYALVDRIVKKITHDDYIPFYRTPITKRQIESVVRTLKTGWLTSGPACDELERRISGYLGVKHGIAVNSCTAALHLSLIASGIGSGDEVITTPFTFVASVESILHSGATPVIVDIDTSSLNLSPDSAAAKISSRTRAIMPVHVAGLPCDLDSLEQIARDKGISIIHDAAHALGASYGNRMIGATPHISCFSFYATKNLTTGEGGMVTTSDDGLDERIRELRLHGMDRNAWKRYDSTGSWYYEVRSLGYKYNLPDVNAALGLSQLDVFESMQERRARVASWYDEGFADVKEVIVPPRNADSVHAWHLYIIRLDTDRLAITRDEFIRRLSQKGVGTSVHFIPVYRHPFYREALGLKASDFPESERAYDRVVTLPLYPGIRRGEVAEVVRRVKSVIFEHRR
jgi:dTDP-4-amino-4,6-dideoxygalactose transaminase